MGRRVPLPVEPIPDAGLTREVLDDPWDERIRSMKMLRNLDLAVDLTIIIGGSMVAFFLIYGAF